jgi:hypothetical protein
MVRATVSGSFHRHLAKIGEAVGALRDSGIKVLSPSDPRVVDCEDEFLYVASDRVRSVRLVQDRHLDAVGASDFLLLVCPDGYVGSSAALEVGFAVAHDVPVISETAPADLTLRQYVQVVSSLGLWLRETPPIPRHAPVSFLLDPSAATELAHAALDRMAYAVSGASRGNPRGLVASLRADANEVSRVVNLRTRLS